MLAIISDQKIAQGDNTFLPEIIDINDYYAFGGQQVLLKDSTLVLRQRYRYGFNGKENDNEVKGEGNQQDYGMRIYDPRLGRFLSFDPIAKQYPELTPYQFAGNTPIQAIDLDGGEPDWAFRTFHMKYLQWKYGDPTGVKTILAGLNAKAVIHTKQASYHNDNVPPRIQERIDVQASAEADAKILIGASKLYLFNTEASLEIASAFVPIEQVVVSTTKKIGRFFLSTKMARSFDEVVGGVRGISQSFSDEVAGFTMNRLGAEATKGGIEVTEASIAKALEGSTMQTLQGKVSLPMVQRYVKMLESGSVAPPIKVANGVIVEGNHRYVAGRLFGVEPVQVPYVASPSQMNRAVPIQKTVVDFLDWGGH